MQTQDTQSPCQLSYLRMELGRRLALLAILNVALCLVGIAEAGKLRVGYYSYTCPKAEDIIREEFLKAVEDDAGIGADLLRMSFHDCFVRGCDGSVLIDSTKNNTAEKDARPNQTIEDEAFDVVDKVKASLEKACKQTVSCADILAFLARDSIAYYGGMYYKVPAGRRDGVISRENDTIDLPPPVFNLTGLVPMFTKKGMSLDDIITLSGAHTVGVAHCPAFQNRLYNFSATVQTDPSLDPAYAAKLMKQCPPTGNNEVPMDTRSPLAFDTSYYKLVMTRRGLFTSDAALMSTPGTRRRVRRFARNARYFKAKFAAAMIKLGKIEVLTGRNGQIRTNCRVVNY